MNQLIPPKSQELPEIGAAASDTAVEIDIGQTTSEYNGSGAEEVTVLTFSGNPKGGYTRYTHYLTNGNKMNVTLKKGNDNLKQSGKDITVNEQVKYVHVYYGGTNGNIPLLIAIKGTNWSYYRNPTLDANSTNWPEEPSLADKDPDTDEDKNYIIVELDILNDKANGQDVIHLEKTPTSGTIPGSSRYKTGQDGTKTITVAQGSAAPSGYAEYTHTPTNTSALSDPTFKFNGQDIQGFPANTITIQDGQPFKVYYEKGDAQHSRPLLAKFEVTGAGDTKPHKYYGRGMKEGKMYWREITELGSNTELNATELKLILI